MVRKISTATKKREQSVTQAGQFKLTACAAAAIWLLSSVLASPKITYVSELGLLNTSGLLMTKRTWFDFFTAILVTPPMGRIPSFCMALRDFFSARLCTAFSPAAPAAAAPASAAPASAPASSSSGTLFGFRGGDV